MESKNRNRSDCHGAQKYFIMPNPNLGCPLIQGKLDELCQKIESSPHLPFWIHETVLSNYIGIPGGKSNPGQSKGLTAILASEKRGHGIQKSTKGEITKLLVVNLTQQNNGTGICYQQCERGKCMRTLGRRSSSLLAKVVSFWQ